MSVFVSFCQFFSIFSPLTSFFFKNILLSSLYATKFYKIKYEINHTYNKTTTIYQENGISTKGTPDDFLLSAKNWLRTSRGGPNIAISDYCESLIDLLEHLPPPFTINTNDIGGGNSNRDSSSPSFRPS